MYILGLQLVNRYQVYVRDADFDTKLIFKKNLVSKTSTTEYDSGYLLELNLVTGIMDLITNSDRDV